MTKSSKNNDEIANFINLEKIGETLQEVAADVVETENEPLTTRWFRSDNEVDVYFWKDSRNNIIKQQVIFCGQVIEWDIIEGTKTGMKIEIETVEENRVAEETWSYDKSPVQPSVEQAITVVQNAHRIQQSERETIVANFRENKTVESMNIDEFYSRFGIDKNQDPQKGLWDRFKKLFKA